MYCDSLVELYIDQVWLESVGPAANRWQQPGGAREQSAVPCHESPLQHRMQQGIPVGVGAHPSVLLRHFCTLMELTASKCLCCHLSAALRHFLAWHLSPTKQPNPLLPSVALQMPSHHREFWLADEVWTVQEIQTCISCRHQQCAKDRGGLLGQARNRCTSCRAHENLWTRTRKKRLALCSSCVGCRPADSNRTTLLRFECVVVELQPYRREAPCGRPTRSL